MAPSRIESVPVEILHLICECLDRASLNALALASKESYSGTSMVLFRTIYIRLFSKRNIELDIDRWIKILGRTGCLKRVLRLKVTSRRRHVDNKDEKSLILTDRERARIPRRDLRDDELYMLLKELDNNLNDEPPDVIAVDDEMWKPLASFIRQLPALMDLVYDSPDRLAPCILDTLHRYRPQCRLHVSKFRLHSLQGGGVDAQELALVTSPSLHSIWVDHCTVYPNDNMLVLDAILQIITGLAPNLKEVRMIWSWHKQHRGAIKHQNLSSERYSLRQHEKLPVPVSLAKFDLLNGPDDLGWSSKLFCLPFENWCTHLDFSTLRVLRIRGVLCSKIFTWMTENCTFNSLTELSLQLDPTTMHENTVDVSDYYKKTVFFLKALPPLTKIEIFSNCDLSTFKVILEHHGQSLRELRLPTPAAMSGTTKHILLLSHYECEEILRFCPNIEYLKLPIRRSMGDKMEVAIYKTLGMLPKVQRLCIMLGSWKPSNLEDDDYVGSKDSAQDVLINSALDEDLARAIFQKISMSKPRDALSLERLELHAVEGDFIGGMSDFEYDDIMRHIARAWLLERSPCRDEIISTELGREAREREENWASIPLYKNAERVFRQVWPGSGSGDWRNDWSSWPLADV